MLLLLLLLRNGWLVAGRAAPRAGPLIFVEPCFRLIVWSKESLLAYLLTLQYAIEPVEVPRVPLSDTSSGCMSAGGSPPAAAHHPHVQATCLSSYLGRHLSVAVTELTRLALRGPIGQDLSRLGHRVWTASAFAVQLPCPQEQRLSLGGCPSYWELPTFSLRQTWKKTKVQDNTRCGRLACS